MKLTFLGATGTVTGSKYLVETPGRKILVDCGLFQGSKELRKQNWESFPIDPAKIDALILTHAHIDHTGYIPVLVKHGFTGKIYCTSSTHDLSAVLLADSGHLQEEEARFFNKHDISKHKPALPLYTKEDAEYAMKYFNVVAVGKEYSLGDELTFQLNRSGHIIGAAFVTLTYNKVSLTFSGDLGRPHDDLMLAPAILQQADYLVLESTYGDRVHSDANLEDQLADIINRTVKRQGIVLIPAFAVGRSQTLIYAIHQLQKERRIPDVPIYLDSPMAIKATEIFCHHHSAHRLSKNEASRSIHDVPHYVESQEESKLLDMDEGSKIIISASGMATGGRILHHLKYFLPNSRHTVILSGFQAAETRGARLAKGEKQIKIFGNFVPVEAEVVSLENISAHADSNEILEWLSHFSKAPRKVFITHGEPESSLALKGKIEERFGWNCEIPKLGDVFSL